MALNFIMQLKKLRSNVDSHLQGNHTIIMTNKFKKFSFDKSHLTINPEAKDFSKTQEDYAVFLPSISAIYAKIVSMVEYRMRDNMPA